MHSKRTKRGVIASPGIIHVQEQGFTLERSISPEELRYYALYWDKVVIPGSNLVYIGIPEEDILIQSGVVERPRVQFVGSFHGVEIAHSFAMAQSVVTKKLIEEDPATDWVMHQFGPALALPPEFTKERRTLRVDLLSALPVPDMNVSIADILEFRERRRDELGELHACLDEVYLEALRSPDPALAGKTAVVRLEAARSMLDDVASERWKVIRKYDLATELNIDGSRVMQGIASGAAFDFFRDGMTVPLGVIGGALASIIKFSARRSITFEPAHTQLKLGYLAKAANERIIGL